MPRSRSRAAAEWRAEFAAELDRFGVAEAA